MTPHTTWAKKASPFTGKVPMKEVPVPQIVMPRKGHTKYDEEFEKLLEFKTGIESTEDGYETLRRALQRFVKFRDIQEQVSIRRQINRKTRMVTIWLEPKKEVK